MAVAVGAQSPDINSVVAQDIVGAHHVSQAQRVRVRVDITLSAFERCDTFLFNVLPLRVPLTIGNTVKSRIAYFGQGHNRSYRLCLNRYEPCLNAVTVVVHPVIRDLKIYYNYTATFCLALESGAWPLSRSGKRRQRDR